MVLGPWLSDNEGRRMDHLTRCNRVNYETFSLWLLSTESALLYLHLVANVQCYRDSHEKNFVSSNFFSLYII